MLRKCGHVCELILLGDQTVQLTVQTIDTCLNVTGSSLPGGGLHCDILRTKAIDVALVLATDQIVQIHMMEHATLVSDVADAAIVVQVDTHVSAMCVKKRVEIGRAA